MNCKFSFLTLITLSYLNCSISQAAVTFNFTYEDVNTNSGFGFDDAAEGQARRDSVTAVANYLSTVIDANGSADIHWNTSSNASASTNLGSMGSFYFQNQGVDDGLIFKHLTTGVDPTSSAVDGTGQINFGHTWNTDNTATAFTGFDLFTVVLHEITHALGFNSLIDNTDGSAAITGTYSRYDTFLSGTNGNFLTGSAFTGDLADLTDGNVKFASSSLGALDIYSPSPYEDGSSISHLAFSHNAVMNPAIMEGVAKRTYAAEDLAVLSTIGYNITSVPEPSTFLFAFSGIGALMLRRKRS